MAVFRIGQSVPRIHPNAYVASSAVIIGNVEIGESSSVWPNAVLRGDNDKITVGAGTNIQDGVVVHTDPGYPTSIGDRVSVGHQAVLHGCTVADDCLIGIQAVILNRAVIQRSSLVAACSVVSEGKTYPENSLILGSPARVIRQLLPDDTARMRLAATDYVLRAQRYASELEQVG